MPIRNLLRSHLPAWLASRPGRICAAMLAAMLACALMAGPSRAEDAQRHGPSRIEAALADVAPLSVQQMAAQSGEGIPVAVAKPGLGQPPAPRIILWDEMQQQTTSLSTGSSSQSVSVTVRATH